jgi:hypothetical protein
MSHKVLEAVVLRVCAQLDIMLKTGKSIYFPLFLGDLSLQWAYKKNMV